MCLISNAFCRVTAFSWIQQHEHVHPDRECDQTTSEAQYQYVSSTLSSAVTRQSNGVRINIGEAHLAPQETAVVVDHPGADALFREVLKWIMQKPALRDLGSPHQVSPSRP